jgi:alpha-tubulin suppressor-like RCC1 family protein
MLYRVFRHVFFENYCSKNLRLLCSFAEPKPRSFRTKVLGWGDNSGGQLGLGVQLKATLPTVLSWSSLIDKNVRQIGCGEILSFIITQTGELYSCGDGERCQNGHSETVRQWTKVDFDLPVSEVAGGKYHTIILTENGQVYSMGENTTGQLGYFQTEIQRRPKRIDAFKGVKIVSIVNGGTHNLALDDNGVAYVWGNNIYGQAGNGTEEIVWEPQPIASLDGRKVSKVSAGLSHSLVLTTTGELYGMGSNKQGQLGLGERIRRIPIPTLIDTFQFKSNERIVDVVSGLTHNLVLTSQGNLFGFGSNQHCQIWRGNQLLPNHTMLFPVKIPLVSQTGKIRMICAGYFHSFTVVGDNELWAWGLGNDFQLGNGKQTSTGPIKIEHSLLQNVTVLSLKGGWGHTLALVQEDSLAQK